MVSAGSKEFDLVFEESLVVRTADYIFDLNIRHFFLF